MFQFKQFKIEQNRCAMKVGTDGVLLGAWARGGLRVLDVGTGTGVIALMMAQRCPEASILAIDIDEGAVGQTVDNVEASPFSRRVTVVNVAVQDLGQMAEHQGTFDAIVSNPPFFIQSLQAPDAQRTVARHTTTLSYAELMEGAWHLLSDDGELSVVVPFDYRQRMEDEATFRGFFPSRICAVRTRENKPPRRYLLAFRKQPCPCQRDDMTIGDERYTMLTSDFYL